MRQTLIDLWLYCECQSKRKDVPTQYMIERIHYSVDQMSDDDVLSYLAE
jgi:hypothetical protein